MFVICQRRTAMSTMLLLYPTQCRLHHHRLPFRSSVLSHLLDRVEPLAASARLFHSYKQTTCYPYKGHLSRES